MNRSAKVSVNLYRRYLKLKRLIKAGATADFFNEINRLISRADVYILYVPAEIVMMYYTKRSDVVEELEIVVFAGGVKTVIWVENLKYKKEIVVNIKQYVELNC